MTNNPNIHIDLHTLGKSEAQKYVTGWLNNGSTANANGIKLLKEKFEDTLGERQKYIESLKTRFTQQKTQMEYYVNIGRGLIPVKKN